LTKSAAKAALPVAIGGGGRHVRINVGVSVAWNADPRAASFAMLAQDRTGCVTSTPPGGRAAASVANPEGLGCEAFSSLLAGILLDSDDGDEASSWRGCALSP